MNELCRVHETRLASIEGYLRRQSADIGELKGGMRALCDNLLPRRKRPDSNPPAGTMQLKTKWLTVRGSAPWVVLLACLCVVALLVWAKTAESRRPGSDTRPASSARALTAHGAAGHHHPRTPR